MTDHIRYAAKAITAVLAVIVAALAAGQLDAPAWLEVVLTALIAGIGVYLVPNTNT